MPQFNSQAITLASVTLLIGLFIGYGLWGTNATNSHAAVKTTNDSAAMSTMNHSMDDMMMDMTANMKGKTGDELDHVFLDDMITHHQGAVDMAKLLKEGTARPELKKFADDIITAQTAEIAQMKEWNTQWFGIHSH